MSNRTISSATIDEIAKIILNYDAIDVIEIPTKVSPDSSYDNGLADNYRAEDIASTRNVLLKANMTLEDLSAMDALLRWNFRNSGRLARSAYGLIAAALSEILLNARSGYYDQSTRAAVLGEDLTIQFSQESMWAIKRMIRMTVATGSHECKIPLRLLADEYEQLSEMQNMFGTDVYDVEADKAKKILSEMTSSTPIDQSQDKMDLARKLAIQTALAISEYRQDETFGRLRGFLNNVTHFANYLRIMTTGTDPELNRLCFDVMDQVHSTDRLLNSNCIAALDLIDRIRNNEVVYERILTLGKHQHRVMAVEVASCIGLFSYLIKKSSGEIANDSDVRKTLGRLMKFSGVSTRYINEINNKQG